MAQRKLAAEVERTLKKVTEGVELFEGIYEKMQLATNQTQKEKLEADLKSQIKKLQRHRDTIKTWLTSNEIKDKKDLLNARKVIETQMERFKATEKEMKTKAFSKEGLTAMKKLDPKEQEVAETCQWVSEMVDELSRQIESTEAEVETLQVGQKKKKGGGNERVAELECLNDRRKWHISRLEVINRTLQNGQLDIEKVTRIKEDIAYFVESNMDEGFMDNEEVYDDLNLEQEEEAFGMGGDDIQSSHDSTSVADATEAPPQKAVPKEVPKVKEEVHKSPDSKKPARKPTLDNATRPVINATTTKPAPSPTVGGAAPVPRPVQAALPPIRYAAAAAAAVVTAPQATVPTVTTAGATVPPTLTAANTVVLPPSTAASMASTLPAPPPSLPHPPHLPQVSTAAQPSRKVSIGSSSAAPPSPDSTTTRTIPLPSPVKPSPPLTPSPPSPQSVTNDSTTSPEVPVRPPSEMLSPKSNATAEWTSPRLTNTTLPSATPSVVGEVQQQQRPTAPNSLNDLVTSFEGAKSKAQRSENDLGAIHQILDAGFSNVPQPLDADKPTYYAPKNPVHTPPYYPQHPMSLLNSPQYFAKFDIDLLFYIFYYCPGTYAQYLAAQELKKQSWRFHKQYLTWFQRASEPDAITDEYEQGVYCYFDWESGWSKRKKNSFIFEYRFLSE